jgi:hypothetical protein
MSLPTFGPLCCHCMFARIYLASFFFGGGGTSKLGACCLASVKFVFYELGGGRGFFNCNNGPKVEGPYVLSRTVPSERGGGGMVDRTKERIYVKGQGQELTTRATLFTHNKLFRTKIGKQAWPPHTRRVRLAQLLSNAPGGYTLSEKLSRSVWSQFRTFSTAFN